MSESVRVEVEDGVATVTIDRPEKLNALNREVIDGIERAFVELEGNDGARAVVVTGAGDRAFVAGADIGELAALDPLEAERASRRGQDVFGRIAAFRCPVVAAIGGYALGGGLELALACHLRVASAEAKLGLPEITLGILPGYGGTQRLPRLVGLGRALDLMLTGRMVEADEALRMGLVNRVHPPEEYAAKARELASELAARAPIAARFILTAAREGLEQPLDQGLGLEATLFGLIAGTEDTKEGLRAFLDKRKPSFRGR